MPSNNEIHVALASDDNYFEGLLTTAWTIVRNCSRPGDVVLHILDGGISQDHWALLTDRLASFGCAIDRLKVDQGSSFGGFRSYHGGGKMTYARLLLPDLLPTTAQIVYSDVDIIWLADIAELWDSLDPDAIIHCTPSKHTIPAELEWFERYGYKFEYGKRFCAGMIAMNLAKFRAESLHHKMLKAIERSNGNTPCVDETVLNALTFWREDRGYLDPRWQHMSFGQLKPLEPNGFVLHFGTDAPWQSVHKYHHLLTNQHLIWHGFHAEARQITRWQSMRMCNSILDIVCCRTLYVLGSRNKIGRAILQFLLWLKNKSDSISYIDMYLRPFVIPDDFRRKLLPPKSERFCFQGKRKTIGNADSTTRPIVDNNGQSRGNLHPIQVIPRGKIAPSICSRRLSAPSSQTTSFGCSNGNSSEPALAKRGA